jgi:hypothetical protein
LGYLRIEVPMSQPISISLLMEDGRANPLQHYATCRFREYLEAIPGVSIQHAWSLPAEKSSELGPVAGLWSRFDAGWAGLERGVEKPTVALGAIGALPSSEVTPDYFFVHSSRPDSLSQAADRARRGAFELRTGGAPLAGVADLAAPEVLSSSPFVGLELCFLAKGSPRAVSLGPWQVRTHRTSPASTAKELIDACGWFLELGLRAVLSASHRSRLEEAPVHGLPGRRASSVRALALFAQFFARKLRGRMRLATVRGSQWGIGVFQAGGPDVVPRLPSQTRWLAPERTHFWADPFLVEEDGRTFLLFEELAFADWRGHLCASELSDDGKIKPRRILEKPFHLSFPFCFRHEGQIYLLPEQAQSGQVRAYRAKAFPFEWEDGPVLLADFPGIDNVLLEHGGRWWLFTTSARGGNHDNHLLLFHARTPFGPFEPHPLNPIRMGLEGSRMAGAVLKTGGKLLRPAQNCSRAYGGSLQFYEIEELTPLEYRERKVREILPDPLSGFPLALHSWSRVADRIAIDGMRELRRW